jgi:hypothetical protein
LSEAHPKGAAMTAEQPVSSTELFNIALILPHGPHWAVTPKTSPGQA